MPKNSQIIYKVAPISLWTAAESAGTFIGSPVDMADGFIHFSTAKQLAETLAKHFTEQDGLLLIAVAADTLGEQLRWEPSRGGALFPHLYGNLGMNAVVSVCELPLGDDGVHILPFELPG